MSCFSAIPFLTDVRCAFLGHRCLVFAEIDIFVEQFFRVAHIGKVRRDSLENKHIFMDNSFSTAFYLKRLIVILFTAGKVEIKRIILLYNDKKFIFIITGPV